MSKKIMTLVFVVTALLFSGAAINANLPPYSKVLILMYHDITEEPTDNIYSVTQATLRSQIETLQNAGYEFIGFDELIAFADYGRELPRRPVVITFDDGYRSSLELAAPVLEELGICATINIIGSQVGKSTYRHTDIATIPHFSFEEARPWVQRGVIHIGHHSHDMHMVHKSEDPFRRGVLQREGESADEYRKAFIRDFKTLKASIKSALGITVNVYAYPYGFYNADTEAMLKELGIRVTLTTNKGINRIERGNPDSLFALKRINMEEELVGKRLLRLLRSFER